MSAGPPLLFVGRLVVLFFVSFLCTDSLLVEMAPDRILSVTASIDTIGEILLKIIPTLEEVSQHEQSE